MNISGILVILILFLLFWVLLIRPQRRRVREQQELHAGLRIGDEVVTAGGILGEITRLEDDEVRLRIAPGVDVRVARRAIAAVTSGEDEEEEDALAEPAEDGAEPPPEREHSG